MAYQFPQHGGLQINYGGKTVGVFVVDSGVVGWAVMVAVQDPIQGWLGSWNSGFKLESQIVAEINGAGGMLAWLKKLVDLINAALAAIFGTTAPGTQITVENLNKILASNFALVAGPSSPVFGEKV